MYVNESLATANSDARTQPEVHSEKVKTLHSGRSTSILLTQKSLAQFIYVLIGCWYQFQLRDKLAINLNATDTQSQIFELERSIIEQK